MKDEAIDYFNITLDTCIGLDAALVKTPDELVVCRLDTRDLKD